MTQVDSNLRLTTSTLLQYLTTYCRSLWFSVHTFDQVMFEDIRYIFVAGVQFVQIRPRELGVVAGWTRGLFRLLCHETFHPDQTKFIVKKDM